MSSLETLTHVLEQSQRHGFLGKAPVVDQITHAQAFAAVLPDEPGQVVDLGSGGGLPGLVIAVTTWTTSRWILLEGSTRRCEFLREAVEQLDLAPRVQVYEGRAELAGRDEALRGQCDVIVSRSFGPPGVLAECAAPLLRLGGTLIVSEPPASLDSSENRPERWPEDGPSQVGLLLENLVVGPPAFAVLAQVSECPDRYPRRVGIPQKRPIF